MQKYENFAKNDWFSDGLGLRSPVILKTKSQKKKAYNNGSVVERVSSLRYSSIIPRLQYRVWASRTWLCTLLTKTVLGDLAA